MKKKTFKLDFLYSYVELHKVKIIKMYANIHFCISIILSCGLKQLTHSQGSAVVRQPRLSLEIDPVWMI